MKTVDKFQHRYDLITAIKKSKLLTKVQCTDALYYVYPKLAGTQTATLVQTKYNLSDATSTMRLVESVATGGGPLVMQNRDINVLSRAQQTADSLFDGLARTFYSDMLFYCGKHFNINDPVRIRLESEFSQNKLTKVVTFKPTVIVGWFEKGTPQYSKVITYT